MDWRLDGAGWVLEEPDCADKEEEGGGEEARQKAACQARIRIRIMQGLVFSTIFKIFNGRNKFYAYLIFVIFGTPPYF